MKRKVLDEEQEQKVFEETADLEELTKGVDRGDPLGEIPPEPLPVKKRRPRHPKYIPCI